jgi:TatD DNase family protein
MSDHCRMWIDSHCHIDAAEFDSDREAVVGRARAAGVAMFVVPAIELANFDAVRKLAHGHGAAYALGIHPLHVANAGDDDLDRMAAELRRRAVDPRLVAVGEIGLDPFAVMTGSEQDRERDRTRQMRFFAGQLKIARDAGLPVILHLRRNADLLLEGLRRIPVCGGIAHAYSGNEVQARQFVELGFALGFGGLMTFQRANQIRDIAAALPRNAVVVETDAPDIPPEWLYRAEAGGGTYARNEPAELPRIGATLAKLRHWSEDETAATTAENACAALPRLRPLC